jgi:hypothetical protein
MGLIKTTIDIESLIDQDLYKNPKFQKNTTKITGILKNSSN